MHCERLAMGFTVLVAFGCADPPRDFADGPDSSAESLRAEAAEGPGTDCPMDTTARHADPVALVEEFVRRDAEGPFERDDLSNAWHDAALTCVERRTSDQYEVITAFRVEELDRYADSVRVLVHRTRALEIAWDSTGRVPELLPSAATWLDTVLVVQTRFGWRIDRFHAGAHRLPGRALGELSGLNAADSARLQQLLARPDA